MTVATIEILTIILMDYVVGNHRCSNFLSFNFPSAWKNVRCNIILAQVIINIT